MDAEEFKAHLLMLGFIECPGAEYRRSTGVSYLHAMLYRKKLRIRYNEVRGHVYGKILFTADDDSIESVTTTNLSLAVEMAAELQKVFS